MYLASVSRKSWKRHLVQNFGVIGQKELKWTLTPPGLSIIHCLAAKCWQLFMQSRIIEFIYHYLSVENFSERKFWMCCDVLAFLRKRLPRNICWINKVQRFFCGFLKNLHLTKVFYVKISYSDCCKYRFYFSSFLFLNIHLTFHFVQTLFMGTGLLFYTLVESLTR